MTELITSRRNFLGTLIGLIAAPAIVRVSSLMPVKVLPPEELLTRAWTHNIGPIGLRHGTNLCRLLEPRSGSNIVLVAGPSETKFLRDDEL